MESRKTRIMPYVFVCGMGILNLILMALPFFNDHGLNISGYVLISSFGGVLGVFISAFQIIVMTLSFGMMIYGAVGILYACGLTGVDMSSPRFRLFCTFPIVTIIIFYLFQFVFVIIYSIAHSLWIGIGVYMSFFLNIAVAVVYMFLLKESRPATVHPRVILFNKDNLDDNN